MLATWVTFTPCFLWIFLGAPFVEQLRGNKALSAALSAITAAVVGVIFNLAIWFAIHTVFRKTVPVRAFPLSFDAPVLTSVDGWALALSVAAAIAIFRFKVGMIQTLAACCGRVVLYMVGAIAMNPAPPVVALSPDGCWANGCPTRRDTSCIRSCTTSSLAKPSEDFNSCIAPAMRRISDEWTIVNDTTA